MTVKELIDVSPFCDFVEIIIRENGCSRWIQGYEIGVNADVGKYDLTLDYKRHVHIKNGQEIDVLVHDRLPKRVIRKDVKKIPDYIGNLQICAVQPRHIPVIHKETLTHNDFAYEINCFPKDFVKPEIKTNETEIMKGQMSISDFLEYSY